MVIWVGILVLFTGSLLFGVLALRRKLLPRWNWLPLVAGLWFPVAVLIAVVGGDEYQRMAAVTAASALISAVSLLPLGYILQADTPRGPATA